MSEQDYIAGLSIYRIRCDLRHGVALIVDHFMALDLFDRAAVVHKLADALEALGRERGCTAVHTCVPDWGTDLRASEGSLVAALRECGHRVESLRLCKVLECSAQGARPRGAQNSGQGGHGRSPMFQRKIG